MTNINSNYIPVISTILIVAFIYVIILLYKKAARRKIEADRLEEERLEQERLRLEAIVAKRLRDKKFIEDLYPDILKANKTFSKYTLYKSGYFNNNRLVFWKQSISDLRKKLNKHNLESLGLDISIISEINQLNRFYENCRFQIVQTATHLCSTLVKNSIGY